MVMTKTRKARAQAVAPVKVEAPMVLLEAMGIVTRGNLGLVDVLDPYFREVLGEDYRTRLKNVSTRELRTRISKYMQPGEKLSDLVIQMREE